MEEIIRKLIAFETTTNNLPQINACLDFVAGLFTEEKFMTDRNSDDKSPYLVVRRSNVVQTWLYAHIDVVPAKPSQFKLRRTDDKLIGRGTYDMKAIVAGYVQILRETSATNIGMILVSDEESGESASTKAFIDRFITGGELVVLPDGGGPLMYETGAKGALWLNITVSGKPAHGSRPFLGKNAIEAAFTLVNALKELLEVDNTSPSPEATTLTLSKLNAGQSTNAVPEKAVMSLDLRYKSQTAREACLSFLDKQPAVSYEVLLDNTPYEANLTSPEVLHLIESINAQLRAPLQPTFALGGSDAGHFAAAGAVPFVFYPEGGGHHGDDEWVSLASLRAITDGLKNFAGRT